MMNKKNTKNLPDVLLRRFFVLLFMIYSFALFATECDTYSPVEFAESCPSPIVVISDSTVVFGLENVHIASSEDKKTETQPKNISKKIVAKKQQFKTKEIKIAYIAKHKKPVDVLINRTKPDMFFHTSVSQDYVMANTSFNFKCIAQHEIEIITFQHFPASIALINLYRSQLFSADYLLKNFQRPPPKLIFLV